MATEEWKDGARAMRRAVVDAAMAEAREHLDQFRRDGSEVALAKCNGLVSFVHRVAAMDDPAPQLSPSMADLLAHIDCLSQRISREWEGIHEAAGKLADAVARETKDQPDGRVN